MAGASSRCVPTAEGLQVGGAASNSQGLSIVVGVRLVCGVASTI